MLLYPIYYRMFGIRRSYNLTSPALHSATQMDIPREAVIHYVGDDVASYGMAGDDLLIQKVNRTILVDYVTNLTAKEGNPRSTYQSIPKMIKDYQRKYRRFRQVKDLSFVWRDTRSTLQVDYALLHHLYKYVKSMYSSYFAWKNVQATLWDTLASMTKASDRQHFIPCRLPTVLPSVSLLLQGETNFSRNVQRHFVEPESLFILEIWKWLGKHRDKSLLASLSQDQLNKVNLIWEESGRWFVLNLGLMDSWRRPPNSEIEAKATDDDDEEVDTSKTGPMTYQQLQKRFLRLLMFLHSQRTEIGSQAKTEPAPKTPDTEAKPDAKKEDAKVVLPTLRPLEEDQLSSKDVSQLESQIDQWVDEDLEALEKFQKDYDNEDLPEQQRELDDFVYTPPQQSLEESVVGKADNLADSGLMTAAQYRSITKAAEAYKTLADPYGEHETLAQQMVIPKDLLKVPDAPVIPDEDTILDKSMLSSTLFHFDRNYTQKVLKKDIVNAVMHVQHAGVAVTGYSVEHVQDALNSFEAHTVKLTPVSGSPTTVRFRVPKVREDGTYLADGVRYRMRKQRRDMPIRKVGPSKVAMSSYYAKVFIERSQKAVNNYPQWLVNQIRGLALSHDDSSITNLKISDVFDPEQKGLPRLYSTLAASFESFNGAGYQWYFDYANRVKHFEETWKHPGMVEQAEKDGMTMIALEVVRSKDNAHRPILVDKNDTLYQLVGSELNVLGKIEDVLRLQGKPPIEQLDIRIYGKNIPLGLFLAYHVGLSGLVSMLKVKPRIVRNGERVSLGDDEYSIVFSDETWVFQRDNRLAAMVLSGFRLVGNAMKNYRSDIFDKKDIYFNLLESLGLGVRYLREMDLMVDMFIDPITKELLEEMQEPTDFIRLSLRAAEMLQSDYSPDETDMTQMRICGYERIAGAVYGELVKAMRTYQRGKGSTGNTIEMPPYAVWNALNQDPAVCLVEESNPVHNLKEKEEVTYTGAGGRSRRSLVKNTRVFHPSDMAVISEATKDSGDTGVTTFLTADPNFANLRGVTKPWDGKVTPTKLMSTSALLAPCADRDDGKRVNFISIQQSSGMSAIGYRPTPLRTGYEQVLAHRVDDLFAYTAKEDGVVTAVSPKAITITYKDGLTRSVELGRRFGIVAGTTMPHTIESTLKEGDKVKKGDLVAFNSHYFEVDPHDPKQAIWKAGVMVKTAVLECADTLEDSSVISEETAAKMAAYTTKVREIVVKFDQSIHQLVSVGDDVEGESILCTIEDPFTANNTLFGDDSLNSLRLLSQYTPRAKYHGKVEKIEVYYNGETEDMSESLKAITQSSDKLRRQKAKELNETYTNGQVDASMHVDKRPLEMDHLVIKIYITGLQPASVGDKGVFGNQLKTIFGRVMSGKNETESGTKVDALFSYESIAARIVLSPEIMGTTNTLLRVISKRVADVYRGRVVEK
jgi:hypothetical protein